MFGWVLGRTLRTSTPRLTWSGANSQLADGVYDASGAEGGQFGKNGGKLNVDCLVLRHMHGCRRLQLAIQQSSIRDMQRLFIIVSTLSIESTSVKAEANDFCVS